MDAPSLSRCVSISASLSVLVFLIFFCSCLHSVTARLVLDDICLMCRTQLNVYFPYSVRCMLPHRTYERAAFGHLPCVFSRCLALKAKLKATVERESGLLLAVCAS